MLTLSVSLPDECGALLDALAAHRGYKTREAAARFLVEAALRRAAIGRAQAALAGPAGRDAAQVPALLAEFDVHHAALAAGCVDPADLVRALPAEPETVPLA